ncbi:HI0074 family nucleotidyltransferase substrate-binding subunit [Rhodopila sp.]|uniref:HI0074 family nucleotidyltransferase substrate-binding subunit n=1 Tax=Rhodopila sp. TaxID=2480087 RepID=UPI003D09B7EB
MANPLDVTPLVRAVARLQDGLGRVHRDPADELLRDGLIHRFGLTYELFHRLLRRFIRQTAASPEEVDQMTFQDLIRTANQQALLSGDWPTWHRYRDLRALTSHTYQADTARKVAAAIPAFLAEAEYLRDQLLARTK